MHIFVNAFSASAGGGVTYVRNVVPHFAASGTRTTFLVTPEVRSTLGEWRNLAFLEKPGDIRITERFRYEQMELSRLIEESGADVLLSSGNFALRRSPVPQILLSRNSLYTSADFFRDLRERREFRTWAETRIRALLARRSIQWADVTVAPSAAFADELQRWTGRTIAAIHHGFDRSTFFNNAAPLSAAAAKMLAGVQDSICLLHVSHYNYYRNLETLFRALPILRARAGNRKIKLVLTCTLRSEDNPGEYRAEKAAALIRELGVEGDVVELGSIPYDSLHQVYSACDVYVSAAYAESFAHPLVEAMASGLPIVASDLPVHREICGNAASYFPRFSHDVFAERVLQVTSSPQLSQSLAENGGLRSQDFSWKGHVESIIALAGKLLDINAAKAVAAR